MVKEVYNPKAVIPHAASLHQACAHCAIFPTAASRRSLGRISVPVWPDTLSGRLPVVALVGHHPTNKLIGRGPIPHRKSFPPQPMQAVVLSGIRPSFPSLSRSAGQITHVLLTRSPLEYPRKGLSVRLACVKHAASVRPEPESNSPNKNTHTQQAQAEFESEQSDLTKRHQKLASQKQPHPHTGSIKAWQKNNNKNKTTKHTIEFSNNTRFRATLLLYSIAKAPSNCTSDALEQACVAMYRPTLRALSLRPNWPGFPRTTGSPGRCERRRAPRCHRRPPGRQAPVRRRPGCPKTTRAHSTVEEDL